MSKESARNQGLKIALTRNRLVISIGLNTLKFAAEAAPGMSGVEDGGVLHDDETLHVTSVKAFGKAVARELEHESEDGTTAIHSAIDAAIERMLESGDNCIILPPEPSA